MILELNKTSKKVKLLLLSVLFTNIGFAQVETENPTSEFIYKGDHFVPGSPWLNFGFGGSYNFSEVTFEPNFFVDFHYQLKGKKQIIGGGYLTSREQFFQEGPGFFVPNSYLNYSLNSLHATYGWRIEKMRHNFAFSIGPGYHWGNRFLLTDEDGNDFHTQYREIGVYANIQYTFKLFYDVGTGLSLWGSYNQSYQAVGLSWHIYLSTAFKRKL